MRCILGEPFEELRRAHVPFSTLVMMTAGNNAVAPVVVAGLLLGDGLRDRIVEGKESEALRNDLNAIPEALVIGSKADQIVGAPDESALPPGFKVVLIDGAGHMPHLEKANEVNALIVDVVKAG